MLGSREGIRNAAPPLKDYVSRDTLQWLLFSQGIAVLPLFFFLPLWMPLMWFVVVAARVQMFRGAWPFPRNMVKTAMGVVCIAGLVFSYKGAVGVEPMVAFLVVAFVLKLVEVRDRNGVVLIVFIGFIAVAALFIFSQSFWTALYSLFTLTVLFGCLQSMYRSRPRSVPSQVKDAFYLLLKSLPLMGILFLVLPRVGPLWAVPDPGTSGKTGFSDTMSPGDISNLVRSQEIAFRVNFDPDETGSAEVPPPQERYWRGLTLDTFDGRSWLFSPPWNRTGDTVNSVNRPHPDWDLRKVGTGKVYKYSVLMEAHRQAWLFSLMVPMSAKSELKMGFTDDYLMMTAKEIRKRVLYRVESHTGYIRSPSLSPRERETNLFVPIGNPRTFELANRWVSRGLSPAALVQEALSFYRDKFSYSLQPPPLGEQSVDEFLFDTQIGFCEHFASSFTFLMRASGVPARVVIGYQGGTFSEDASHLVVRQLDAHAWAEVWLENKGWVRVDPTNAVAPDRIQLGIQEALNSSEASLLEGGFISRAWFQQVKLRFEELEYLWQKNVLSYDKQRQSSFLENLLGGKASWRTALFLIGTVAILLFLYQFMPRLFSTKKQLNPATKLYLKYVKSFYRNFVNV